MEHPETVLCFSQQQAPAKPQNQNHSTAAQHSTPLSPPSTSNPHQEPSKQKGSEEPGVSEDGHTGHTALATDTRELKGSESAQHWCLTPHCSPGPVTHKVTSKGAPQSTIAASDIPVTKGEE